MRNVLLFRLCARISDDFVDVLRSISLRSSRYHCSVDVACCVNCVCFSFLSFNNIEFLVLVLLCFNAIR